MSTAAPTPPPARRILLLVRFAPGAAVVFALLAVWMVVSTVRGVGQLAASLAGPGVPVLVGVVQVVLSAATATVAGLVAYRLGVQVPWTLRAWDDALGERSRRSRGE